VSISEIRDGFKQMGHEMKKVAKLTNLISRAFVKACNQNVKKGNERKGSENYI
jgi:hypothetical protein